MTNAEINGENILLFIIVNTVVIVKNAVWDPTTKEGCSCEQNPIVSPRYFNYESDY